jgi:hypothetical protein
MLPISAPSISDHLTLEETVARLGASARVVGVAEFGSRTTGHANSASDYDLFVLATALPAPFLQLVTTIGGRLADVILISDEIADRILAATAPFPPMSIEDLVLRDLRLAHIWYDPSERLHKVQQLATTGAEWEAQPSANQHDFQVYMTWFGQSLMLLHLERMAQSQNQIHLSAVDLKLAAGIPGTWKSYFEIRQLPSKNEKAALRYWAEHDPEYLQTILRCLALQDRNEKLATYRDLVERTLAPLGKVLHKGETAVMLSQLNGPVELQQVLNYWESLFEA